jgi:hypothetical protein
VCVLVPYYLQQYGPTNFLWFCDVALIVTLVGIWTESRFLISMASVAIVFPQLMWVADFCVRATTGGHLIDMTEYMFDPENPLFVRCLSAFHDWMPFLLLWLVAKLGYDRRAVLAQTVLCSAVLLTAFLVLDGPNGPAGNVNKIFGPNDAVAQTWMPHTTWLGVLMFAYPVIVYLPSHLVFKRLFREEPAYLSSSAQIQPASVGS